MFSLPTPEQVEARKVARSLAFALRPSGTSPALEEARAITAGLATMQYTTAVKVVTDELSLQRARSNSQRNGAARRNGPAGTVASTVPDVQTTPSGGAASIAVGNRLPSIGPRTATASALGRGESVERVRVVATPTRQGGLATLARPSTLRESTPNVDQRVAQKIGDDQRTVASSRRASITQPSTRSIDTRPAGSARSTSSLQSSATRVRATGTNRAQSGDTNTSRNRTSADYIASSPAATTSSLAFAVAPALTPELRTDRSIVRVPKFRLVVAAKEKKRSRPLVLGLFVLAFLLTIGSGAVSMHAALAERQLKLDRLNVQIDENQRMNQRLRVEVATLEAPARIVTEAQVLGLKAPQSVRYLAAVSSPELLPVASTPVDR
jgi:cell division protein FtsL